MWLDTSHLGRKVETYLPLGPQAFRASNLTKTKVQQDAQRKAQNKGNVSLLSVSAEISLALKIGFNINSICVIPAVVEYDSSQIHVKIFVIEQCSFLFITAYP